MATTTISRDYRAFIRTLRRILLYPGLWPVVEPSLFYRSLPTFMCVLCLVQCWGSANFVRIYHSSIPIMTQGMSAEITFTTIVLKLLYMNPNRKCVRELHETMDRMAQELLNDIASDNLVLKKFHTLRRLTSVFMTIVFSSSSTYGIFPMAFIIYQYIHHIQPIKYILATPAVYPWPIANGGAIYFCQYAFEVTNYGSLFSVTAGVDTFFTICIFLMSAKLSLMSHRLKTSKHDADYDTIVHQCLTDYEMLLKCRTNIEKIYGPVILWMLLTSAIVLCANIYQIPKSSQSQDFSLPRLCFFVIYMSARLFQTFIYTWCGSTFTTESEMFIQAVYASKWPVTGQRRFTSSILIMLTQKPLVITACGCAAISIDMFAKILNTAISYFFLLRTMESKGT